MATKQQAKITLVGPLSYATGRFRFVKDKPQFTEDQEVINHLKNNPDFKVEMVEVAVDKKAAAASKPAGKPAQAPEVSSDEGDEDQPSLVKKATQTASKVLNPKSAQPSKLTKKDSEKETAHETD